MAWSEPYRNVHARQLAQSFIRNHGIEVLPVDVFRIAADLDIIVQAKSQDSVGVSGMLIRVGSEFGIAYATHIANSGFQRFSVAHELGHYILPGHVDHVLPMGTDIHESRAGFVSNDPYELEADHFASRLLMPDPLFEAAMRTVSSGLEAITDLSALCETSLTATAIRYAQAVDIPLAAIISTGKSVNYCFMSEELKEIRGLGWLRKGYPVPSNTVTSKFNADLDNVLGGDRDSGVCECSEWFTTDQDFEMNEEVVGLGRYGKTLTVLSRDEIPDTEEEEEEELIESWTPRFRR